MQFVRSEQPLTRVVDGELVMFHPAKGEYFALSGIGPRVWELLERPATLAEVCAALRSEFAVDAERCEADVREFIEELRSAQLVEERP
jgi:PqqD family protein of HPr-rel-A system